LTKQKKYDRIKNKQQGRCCQAVGSLGGKCKIPNKEGVLMNELSELLAQLTELLKQLTELLEDIEYIAIKRAKK